MAYHTIGKFQRREYFASNLTSAVAAVVAVGNRGQLEKVYQAAAANLASTTIVGSWTVLLNGTQVTGLSSVAVPAVATAAGAAGVQQTSGSPSVNTYLYSGDVLSVTGSSLMKSNWTFVVREF